MSAELKLPADEAYDLIDRFLRNNLDDTDYATFSDALEVLATPAPGAPGQEAAAVQAVGAWQDIASLLQEDDVFALIGQAVVLQGRGETDMPTFFLDLAARIAHARGDQETMDRVHQVATQLGLQLPAALPPSGAGEKTS